MQPTAIDKISKIAGLLIVLLLLPCFEFQKFNLHIGCQKFDISSNKRIKIYDKKLATDFASFTNPKATLFVTVSF